MRDRARESLLGEKSHSRLWTEVSAACSLLLSRESGSPGSCVTRRRAGWRGARVCGEQTEKALLIHFRQHKDVALSAGIARIIVILLLVYVV